MKLPDGAHIWPDVLQQSEEWFRVRTGKATASQFKRIITPANGRLAAGRESYIHDLIGQCYAPFEMPTFAGNSWTDRGNELEVEARTLFAADHGLVVDQVGFVTNKRWGDTVGCSPDGLVGKQGASKYHAGLEIKCLARQNHVAIWDARALPAEYKAQVHGGMAVTGLRQWWFVSYHPAMAPFCLLVEWDDFTNKLRDALDAFVIEYSDKYAELKPLLARKKEDVL